MRAPRKQEGEGEEAIQLLMFGVSLTVKYTPQLREAPHKRALHILVRVRALAHVVEVVRVWKEQGLEQLAWGQT